MTENFGSRRLKPAIQVIVLYPPLEKGGVIFNTPLF